jgi:hypothetical protein
MSIVLELDKNWTAFDQKIGRVRERAKAATGSHFFGPLGTRGAKTSRGLARVRTGRLRDNTNYWIKSQTEMEFFSRMWYAAAQDSGPRGNGFWTKGLNQIRDEIPSQGKRYMDYVMRA